MRRRPLVLSLAVALFAGGALDAAVVTVTPSKDTTIFEENPDASDAKGPGLFAGRNTLTQIRRGFVAFDVAVAIPAGSTVTAVSLRLVVTQAKGNPVDVNLVRVLAPWSEGTSFASPPGGTGAAATPGDATWTRRVYPGTSWLTPGGDTSASVAATSPIPAINGSYTWSSATMVSDVQSWLDVPATNFGWQVRADELQAAPSARRFGSRESANPAEAPLLTITYQPGGGGGGGGPDGVPALSPAALLALGAALALLGAGALRRG